MSEPVHTTHMPWAELCDAKTLLHKIRAQIEAACSGNLAKVYLNRELKTFLNSCKEVRCPVCQPLGPPSCDCGCNKGTDCCAWQDHLDRPCLGCGYHGYVLQAPEGAPQELIDQLNQDQTRGMPFNFEEGRSGSRHEAFGYRVTPSSGVSKSAAPDIDACQQDLPFEEQ